MANNNRSRGKRERKGRSEEFLTLFHFKKVSMAGLVQRKLFTNFSNKLINLRKDISRKRICKFFIGKISRFGS